MARRPHLPDRSVVPVRPVARDRSEQARDFERQLLEGEYRSVTTVKTLCAVGVRGTKTLITDKVGDASAPRAIAHPTVVMRALLIAQSMAMLLWDKLAEIWVNRDELYARLRAPDPDQCQLLGVESNGPASRHPFDGVRDLVFKMLEEPVAFLASDAAPV